MSFRRAVGVQGPGASPEPHREPFLPPSSSSLCRAPVTREGGQVHYVLLNEAV